MLSAKVLSRGGAQHSGMGMSTRTTFPSPVLRRKGLHRRSAKSVQGFKLTGVPPSDKMSQDVNLSFGCTRRLLKEDLKVKKRPAKWVPHLLTDREKQRRVNLARQTLQILRQRANPVDVVIAQDESWVNCWDPQPKQATCEWIAAGEDRLEKVVIERSVQKTMLVAFIDKDGLVYREFVPNGLGIGAVLYQAILDRFLTALRRARPHLATRRGMMTWALLQDGAPAHRADPVQCFLRARGVRILPHPGYSPDLNPMDYWFFSKIKKQVKGIRHRDIPQLEQAVDASIRVIPAPEFQAAMDRFPERLRKCIAANGSYFERK